MIREIYIRNESDPNFQEGVIDYQNELESVLSQIRMILGTRNGQVLGLYDFGVDLEYMVFNTKSSAYEVADKINEQIRSYVHMNTDMSVNARVSFGDSGEGYDYAVIDIYVNGVKAVGFLIDKN